MFRLALGTLVCSIILAGCSAPSPLHFKGISNVSVEPVSLSQSKINFTVEVNNPNKYPLSVKSWEASIFIDSKQAGQFSSDSAFTIPAKSDFSYSTTLPVNHGAVLNGALQWLARGSVPYSIKGSAKAGRKAIKATVPFTYDGQFALKDILGINR